MKHGSGEMLKGAPKNMKGFTLVEVVAALFIIAVALLAMGKMQTRSIEAAEHAGRVATALRLAQDVIEQMQTLGPTSWVSSSGEQRCPGGSPQNGIECPPYNLDPEGRIGAYQRSWIVSENNTWVTFLDNGRTNARITEVTVTVRWGVNRSAALRGLLFRSTP